MLDRASGLSGLVNTCRVKESRTYSGSTNDMYPGPKKQRKIIKP